MLSKDEEQRDRRETLQNDVWVRTQTSASKGSTFRDHAEAEANQARGRYSAELAQTVVGSEPIPKYPTLPSGPWSGEDLVGQEPSLGYSVDEMSRSRPEQFAVIPAQSATGGAPAVPAVAAPPSYPSPSPQRFQSRPPGRNNIATHSVLGAGGDKLHRRI
jgi:hypothetical protein